MSHLKLPESESSREQKKYKEQAASKADVDVVASLTLIVSDYIANRRLAQAVERNTYILNKYTQNQIKMNRPPLLPWSKEIWTTRWSTQGRLSSTPIPRTPFLLLKAPVSTLYEEKFGGDRNMFTVGVSCQLFPH